MNSLKKLSIISIVFCLLAISQCFLGSHRAEAALTPIITSISPSSATIGDTVTISGSGFLDTFTTTGNTVYFSNCEVGISGCYSYFLQNISSSNGTDISFVLPATMKHSATGAAAATTDASTPTGSLKVSITNANGSSNSFNFTVASGTVTTLAITSASPSSVKIGDAVTILGSGFTTTTYNQVKILSNSCLGTMGCYASIIVSVLSSNGITISFNIPSSIASYPDGITKTMIDTPTGSFKFFVLNGNGQTSNSVDLTITSSSVTVPAIISISPSSANIGDTITITGNSFAKTNTIYFSNCSAGIVGCYSYFLENIPAIVSSTACSATSCMSKSPTSAAYDSIISFVLPATMKHSATGAAAATTDASTPTGSLKVSVTNANGYSNSVDLTICPQGWTLYRSQCVSLIPPPTSTITLIKTPESPNIYLVGSDQKILIPSWQAFVDTGLNSADIKIVSLGEFNSTQAISLLKSQDDARVYAIKEMQKLWIPSAAAFVSLGYKWENIVTLTSAQANIYGTISLARAADSNKVYFLGNGQRQWIITAEKFVALGYNWNDVAVVSNQELDAYALGSDIQ